MNKQRGFDLSKPNPSVVDTISKSGRPGVEDGYNPDNPFAARAREGRFTGLLATLEDGLKVATNPEDGGFALLIEDEHELKRPSNDGPLDITGLTDDKILEEMVRRAAEPLPSDNPVSGNGYKPGTDSQLASGAEKTRNQDKGLLRKFDQKGVGERLRGFSKKTVAKLGSVASRTVAKVNLLGRRAELANDNPVERRKRRIARAAQAVSAIAVVGLFSMVSVDVASNGGSQTEKLSSDAGTTTTEAVVEAEAVGPSTVFIDNNVDQSTMAAETFRASPEFGPWYARVSVNAQEAGVPAPTASQFVDWATTPGQGLDYLTHMDPSQKDQWDDFVSGGQNAA